MPTRYALSTTTQALWLAFAILPGVVWIAPSIKAEVTSSSSHGFRIRMEATSTGQAEVIYRAITRDIGKWWDPAHTYSGDAANLYVVAKPGGYFGETLPKGGFVKHMELAYLAPNQMIRLLGGLGPLQEMGVHGALTITLQPTNASEAPSTRVTLEYNVTGYAPDGLDSLAPIVDKVLQGQLDRLVKYGNRR